MTEWSVCGLFVCLEVLSATVFCACRFSVLVSGVGRPDFGGGHDSVVVCGIG